jgi:hypothetical protein
MMVAGGVSSPKRGRNGGGSLNSDGGSGAPIARHEHEDSGERGGVLARPVKERMGGGGRKGTATMGGTLYNGAGEGRLRESGRCEGCHTAGEDVGGPATTDGDAPAGSGKWAVVATGSVPNEGTREARWALETVPVAGSNSLNRFPNLNGSKMFKFFQTLADPKMISSGSKI